MTPSPCPPQLRTALELAARGIPVLPLSRGKRPVPNCPACRNSRCGDRPHMLATGPCDCPRPCHGWAAATTRPEVITSPEWAAAWRQAAGVAYHPAGASVTVVDLDTEAAVAWARATLPTTATVPTSRGQHWIYQGTMTSHNSVRQGVDIKSRMAYARWRGPGTGGMTALPDAVRALAAREEPTPAGAGVGSSPPRPRWDRTVATGCRHTDAYVRRGLAAGVARVRACAESGAGSAAYGAAAWQAARHVDCPGPCGLNALGAELVVAAVSVGVPERYAMRAVTRGLEAT